MKNILQIIIQQPRENEFIDVFQHHSSEQQLPSTTLQQQFV